MQRKQRLKAARAENAVHVVPVLANTLLIRSDHLTKIAPVKRVANIPRAPVKAEEIPLQS
jgi:hypothetical protein